MLLFNRVQAKRSQLYANFNTSNVTIQRKYGKHQRVKKFYFNTSNVTIQRVTANITDVELLNFNTSNVTIQLNNF